MIPSSAPFLRTVLRVIASTLFVLISGVAAAQENPGATGEAATPPSDTAAAPAPADASAAPAESAPATTESAPNTYESTVPVQEQTAQAAEPAPAGSTDATKLEQVEVTGSRLKRQDFETAQPVAVISRGDIQRSGLTNIGDLLSKMTTAGTSINTSFASLALTGGETNLDLRNLGTNRVLILVDGHRWVNGLTSTSTSAVDLNTIPTSIIERVEVLKDGASAVYGSDAIAGVVNIITRKNYQGLELSSQFGEYEQGDGTTQQHQISFGHLSGGTSFFANFSFTKEDEVKATSRWISAENHIDTGRTRWSTLGPEGRFTFVPTPTTIALAAQACQPTLPVCDLAHTPGTDGTVPMDFHHRGDADKFNRDNGYNIQNPSKRAGFYTQLTQKITDGISFTFQGLYNYRRAGAQIGYNFIQGGDLAGTPAYISATNRYNPFHQDIGLGTPPADTTVNIPLPPTTIPDPTGLVGDTVVGGPTGAGLGVGSGLFGMRLLNDPRVAIFQNDTIRLGGAFDGHFDILGQLFSWDLGYSYSKNSKRESGNIQGVFREDHLERALGPDANCTGDCVPLNLFNGQAGITPAMIRYIDAYTVNHTRVRQDDAYVNITTDLGPIHLPAGPIAIAFGGEYRRDVYDDQPDPLFVQGLTFGNNAQPTSGQNNAREAYIEFGVPLLSDLPAIKMIDLSLAGRYSKYALGDVATTGKAGLRWRVYDDLLLRGTYSSAFRAPSVGELFLGDTVSFDAVNDPCASFRNDPTTNANCTSDGVQNAQQQQQTRAIVGGNRQLKPEKARTLTFGLVFSPGLVRGLNINADYYRISVDQFISVPGSQYILDACYKSPNRAFCQYVHRQNSGTGNLDFIEDRYVNFSTLDTSGIDGGFDYLLPLPTVFGRSKITVDTSYLIGYQSKIPTPGAGDQISPPQTGQSFGGTSVPRWRGNAVYELKRGGFGFSWTTRMVYQRTEQCVDGAPGVPSLQEFGLCSMPNLVTNPDGSITDLSENKLKTVFYHDVQTGYEFTDLKLQFALGVNNVFNRSPPISRDPTFGGLITNYDFLAYDTPGRFFYMRIGKQF